MIKEFPSTTYGKYKMRKIARMSAFTFDAEKDPEVAQKFSNCHPKNHFSSLAIDRTDTTGIFDIYIPLQKDNLDWEPPEKLDTFHRMKMSPKKGELPIVIPAKIVIKWFKDAEQFLIEVDDDTIDELYDEVEKQQIDKQKKR